MQTSFWRRRRVLQVGAATSAGSFLTPPLAAQASRLRTPLVDRLGIEHPLLQAPMSGVVTPQLVAAVSNAGGLGMLPGIMVPPEQLQQQIRASAGRRGVDQ